MTLLGAIFDRQSEESIITSLAITTYFQIADAVQLTGFQRAKRGYKPLVKSAGSDKANTVNRVGDSSDPADPLFKKEWYLVSKTV